MIKLNYQTNNRRWGWSGIKFSNWLGFARVLGYLSNIYHYNSGAISVHIELNDLQGADAREGRIHYYKDSNFLSTNLPDLYAHRSAGVGRITCRINSNDYILSLINDFKFIVQRRQNDEITLDIYPPQNVPILNILIDYLGNSISQTEKQEITDEFNYGWHL